MYFIVYAIYVDVYTILGKKKKADKINYPPSLVGLLPITTIYYCLIFSKALISVKTYNAVNH